MTPLLLCSIGPYALRRRPLMIGLPLDRVAAVRPLGRLMPFPGQVPGLLGLTLHDGQIVPVFSAPALLGIAGASEIAEAPESHGVPGAESGTIADRQTSRHLVVVKGGAGLVGLVVATAAGIDRPLHWADPSVLAPLSGPAFAGAVLRQDRWIAVLDPARLPAPQPVAA